jgi:hypothetical protein
MGLIDAGKRLLGLSSSPQPVQPAQFDIECEYPNKLEALRVQGRFSSFESLHDFALRLAFEVLREEAAGAAVEFIRGDSRIQFRPTTIDSLVRIAREAHESGALNFGTRAEQPLKISLPWKPEYQRLLELGEFAGVEQMLEFTLNCYANLQRLEQLGWELASRNGAERRIIVIERGGVEQG